jgi:HSP20 family molecular chaperone IbpA
MTISNTLVRRGAKEFFGFDPFPELWSMGAGAGYGVSRTEQGYQVEIPVPGFAPEAIEITLKDEVLTVTGKSEKRNFSRTLVVPEDIDPDAINAHVEHGLLTVTLNRRPEAQPRKIAISVNN